MANPTKVINDAFFAERAKINPLTGCIEWTRHISSTGYGTLKYRRKQQMAHRFAWEHANGPIPAGMIVCHKCDNRRCINVDHLFLGTTQDNVDDKMAKGRFKPTFGEISGTAKLTAEQIQAIRDDVRVQTAIAADYGISQSNVSLIKKKVAWAHVEGRVIPDKRMTVREFADSLGLPYQNLKDRIFGGYLSIGEAVNRTALQFGMNLHVPS